MIDTARLDELEVAYARFNATKTLTTQAASEFEVARFGDLIATRDSLRPDGYYNRILGLSGEVTVSFARALHWICGANGDSGEVRVDVAPSALSAHAEHLRRQGFTHSETITWLQAPVGLAMTDSATTAAAARELTVDDLDALRALRDAEWPVDASVWQQKRHLFCTPTFRWFGVFDGGVLVSAASTWHTTTHAILGSAFTLPGHRGRGYQQRLLRLRCARSATPLLVDVAPDSISHRNCVRAGFHSVEHRQVWSRARDA